jgi:hypothetical protein
MRTLFFYIYVNKQFIILLTNRKTVYSVISLNDELNVMQASIENSN